ncbi:MAG: hypothetical protein Q4B22_04455 [Eubacteriales bacterium]|nr:hypothetical protein [Eubacteriales bacterium]
MYIKKTLYACSSVYQVMLSLMKAMTQDEIVDLVLEEHGVPNGWTLMKTITENIPEVDRVYFLPNSLSVDPYLQREASFWPRQRSAVVRHIHKTLGPNFDAGAYKERNIYWDLGYIGTYLNIRGIDYRLLEDSLNSYQHIKNNRPNYSYIFSADRRVFKRKKNLRLGVIPFGYSPYCTEIEVNCKEDLEIPTYKVVEVPRAEIEAKLTEEQKQRLFRVFMPDVDWKHHSLYEKGENAGGSLQNGEQRDIRSGETEGAAGEEKLPVLLLTEPFAITGRLPDEEAQVRMYRDILEQTAGDHRVFIKPHPRDIVNYSHYFPGAVILHKDVPTEILNFDPDFRFSRAVTVTSTAIQNIAGAEEKIALGADFWRKYVKNE